MTAVALVRWLATATPPDEPITGLDDLFARVEAHVPFEAGIARAAAAGACADRAGYAFACGYVAALAFLVPGVTHAALCASEEGGAHPRAIRARVADGRLTGKKSWVTLGSAARELLVVASTGTDADGKNRLVVARIPRDRAGVTLNDRPPAPFAPEVPHAEVSFDDVRVAGDELLPGDGYDRYVKPFRTIEDLFVMSAVLGYAVRVARGRDGAPAWRAWIEEALASVTLLDALARSGDLGDPAVHVALAGAMTTARRLLTGRDSPFERCDDTTRQRWERDLPLLEIAGNARRMRADSAWRRLGP